MGNSNSQSSNRFTTSLLNSNHVKEIRSKKQATKFANPENRVLPIASGAVQRLRSTDNGSILQSGGTISGRKSTVQVTPSSEPEFLHLLQKKCQITQKPIQNHQPHKTLYGHRKSHSDPDIIRMMCEKDSEDDDEDDDDDDIDDPFDQEDNSNSRSIIAVSPSKAKIKSRKKTRAPEPPHSNTLPRSYERTPINYSSDVQRKVSFRKKNEHHDTPRRPLPPIPPEELPPPPPPPPPDYNTQELESKSIIKHHSKNYEKNRRKVDKWKFSKPSVETAAEGGHRQRSKSLDRTEEQRFRECNGNMQKVSIEKKNSLRNINTDQAVDVLHNGNNEKSPLSPNDLKDAIADAARKRAERLERSKVQTPVHYPTKIESTNSQSKPVHQLNKDRPNYQANDHVKQYYFADRLPVKHPSKGFYTNSNSENPLNNRKSDEKVKSHDRRQTSALRASSSNSGGKTNVEGHGDRVPAHKGHRREPSTSTPKQCKWDLMLNEPVRRFLPDGTPSSCSSSEEEMEIDLQLRPTLPRRPIELPRFSPTDVWKSINLDFFKSHQQRSDVSSDDGDEVLEDKIHRINRPVAPRRLINDRSADSGISPDAGSPMPHIDGFEILMTNHTTSPSNRPITPQINEEISPAWVPQHDLADDSDSVSENMPVPTPPDRLRPDSQAKFAMPNFMFPSRSLPRTEQQSNVFENEICVSDKERTRSRGRRKKSYKNAEGQHFNSLRNLKKALGLRSKSPIASETPCLDANWSLSRSLPNFIDNLNADTVKRKVDNSDCTVSDAIKRSNSESKAFPQNNNCTSESKNASNEGPQTNSPTVWGNSFSHQTPDGHVIYLPEYSSSSRKNKLQGGDDVHMNTDSELVIKKSSSRKKFSYQSTVRQEEKKKLEEQLAREVEARERQRQKEIEWMNKVEEEFRKQRDKEKVNIRHQLRILNLQEKSSNQRSHGDNFITSDEISKLPQDTQNMNGNHTKVVQNGNQELREMAYNDYKPTGMRKWLKRQNKYSERNGLCAVRPEPEGGRSSSDDCRQLDWKHDGGLSSRAPRSAENSEVNSKCSHSKETTCGRCAKGTAVSKTVENSDRPKLSSSPELVTPVRSSSVPGKKVERQRSNKEKLQDSANVTENGNFNNDSEISAVDDDYRFIRESVEEYELHTRLCRTNSGRTFESHSYYALERRKSDTVDPPPEGKNGFDKNDDARPKQNIFSSLNFETELKENVRKKTREFEKRTRKHQSRDLESDDSGSDISDLRHQQRHGNRAQRKKKDGSEPREPSFSRNHPHRSAARKLNQVNGHHHLNGRLAGFQKTSNNDHLLPHHRIPSSVLG